MATKKNVTQRHHDALKKTRQDIKRNERNRVVLSRLKTLKKKVDAAKTPEEKQTALQIATSAIDKAGRKKILHHRTASRLVGRLTLRAARQTK